MCACVFQILRVQRRGPQPVISNRTVCRRCTFTPSTSYIAYSQVQGSSYLPVIQGALTSAEKWALSWHGRLGHEKTKVLAMPTDACFSGSLVESPPKIDNSPVSIVNTHRHLGIILSSNLQWGAHVQGMSKSTRRAGLLRWLANGLPSHVAEKIYTMFGPVCSMHLQSGMALCGRLMRMRSIRSKME